MGRSVPEELGNYVQAGLGKTAVNIFVGVAAAARKDGEHLHAAFGEGTYAEETMFSQTSFDYYINNPSLPKLDLYVAQFYPNVDVGSQLTEYRKQDVAANIRKLFADKRTSDPFTVAVDITIDHFESNDVKELLHQFKDEISSGKINFIFLASGQKFYTLGMDNYYGSCFYMVNNGDAKWKKFDSLFTHPIHRTDELSAQWFSLVTKYAPDSIALYRELIFENSRYILDRVPDLLRPNKNKKQTLRINNAAPDMLPCFIDLKVIVPPEKQSSIGNKILRMFYKKMSNQNIITYSRGSFGFYHQNFALFGELDQNVRTIRINPGINPKENDAIVEFFKSLNTARF